MNEELLPCPFCGAGNTEIRDNGKLWSGRGYTRPTSTSVFHHCTPAAGQPSRAIERVGRDRASAIAAWNQRAISAPQAPAAPGMAVTALGGEIVAALEADENDGGYDLTSGLFGPKFSALVRRLAASEWAHVTASQAPSAPAVDESFEDLISDWAHGDALDAARYRWLRDNATRSGVNIDIGAGVEISETLDAAVDDAMRLTAAKESP